MSVNIPSTIDMIQEHGKIITDVPEIRVWIHPHKRGANGSDDYAIFDSFKKAFAFIKKTGLMAEDHPLIAFRGYELDIFQIEQAKKEKGIVTDSGILIGSPDSSPVQFEDYPCQK